MLTKLDGYECEGQLSIFDYLKAADPEPRQLKNEQPKPKKSTYIGPEDDYIREHPTCFYVDGHYLDREEGWHKVPEELPMFMTWHLIDVVLYGKKTGTPWMEHGKWEAKDWAFRSVDDRRNTESVTVLAWKLSEEGNT